jgi:hypothetical protein
LADELLLFSSYQIKKLPEESLYKVAHSPLSMEDLGDIEVKKTNWYTKWRSQGGLDVDTVYTTKKTYVWDAKKGMMIPKVPDSLDKDSENLPVVVDPTNKYYFSKNSVDFGHWIRREKCFVSSDGSLVKAWDKEKKVHFLMSFEDAVKDGTITSPLVFEKKKSTEPTV